MRSFLPKAQVRRLEIIEYLYAKDEWTPLKELSLHFNCSQRVIRDDLATLKSITAPFNGDIEIIDFESSHDGIKLVLDDHIGIDYIYHRTIIDNPAFQLIETILYDETLSAEDLANKFFISPSTLYLMTNDINKVLKKRFDIKIKSNPYRMSGNENQIRSFYSQFYYEKEPGFGWPFGDTVNEGDLDYFIKYFARVVNFNLDKVRYKAGKIVIAINLIRAKHQHFVTGLTYDERILELAKCYASDPMIADQMDIFQNTLGITLDSQTLLQVFFPYVTSKFAYTYEELLDLSQTDEDIHLSVRTLERLLMDLSYKYDLYLPNKQGLITLIHNTANMNLIHNMSSYILFDRRKLFVDKSTAQYPEFSADLWNELDNYVKTVLHLDNKEMVNQLFYFVYIHWEQLIIELLKSQNKIRCLILSNFDTAHAVMLQNFFRYNASQLYVFDIYDDYFKEFETKNLDTLGYDYIIANFPILNLKKTKFIHIDDIPTQDAVNQIVINLTLANK